MIVIVLLLGMIGYFVYDKYFDSKKEPKEEVVENNSSLETEKEEQNESLVGTIGVINNSIQHGNYNLYIDESGEIYAYNGLDFNNKNITQNIEAKAISIIEDVDANGAIRIIALMDDGIVYMNKYNSESEFDDNYVNLHMQRLAIV